MLGTLEPDKKAHWHKYVAPLVHAYNCTRHESTGYAPYFLMFRRHPRLPVDVTFGVNRNANSPNHSLYVSTLKQCLQESYNIATKVAAGAQQWQKARYDLRAWGALLEPGDCVLVRVLAFEGKCKLANKWNGEIYVVESQPNPDIPVYVLYNEADRSSRRMLHRNHLLPIGRTADDRSDTQDTANDQPVTSKRRPVPRPRKRTSDTTNQGNHPLHRTSKICPQTLRRRMKMKNED